MGAKRPPPICFSTLIPGQLTMATHPNPACHNNPARDKTQNPTSRRAPPKKEVRQPHCLSCSHPPTRLHSPRIHSAHLRALDLSRQPLPDVPSQPLTRARTHMAHCNFSFLMELYKACRGRNKPRGWGSILGGGAPMPELRALPPSLGEETELGVGMGSRV